MPFREASVHNDGNGHNACNDEIPNETCQSTHVRSYWHLSAWPPTFTTLGCFVKRCDRSTGTCLKYKSECSLMS